MNSFRRFYVYFTGKSPKQKVCFVIVVLLLLAFVFFMIKGNIGSGAIPENGENSESAESGEVELIQFHINYIDIGILLGVITAYIIHKIREKRKERRL